MSVRRLAGVGAVTTAAALAALAPAAPGRTLGSTAWPLDAVEVPCRETPWSVTHLVGYQATETSTSWSVPNRGVLTSWSTNVTEAEPGDSVSLVVLRTAGADMTIAAVDRATQLLPMPAGGVATFRPATTIALEPGDRLGITGTFPATCGWQDGSIPQELSAEVGSASPGIAPGATVTHFVGPQPASQLNLAAEVLEETDVRVTAADGPPHVVVGALAPLSWTVANAGPAASAVTVTGTVSAGAKIELAVAGGGSCTAAGQQFACAIPSLEPASSAPVVVLVTPSAPGTHTATLAAAPSLESTPADNSATATLTAAEPPKVDGGGGSGGQNGRRVRNDPSPPPRCVVPALARTPLAVARKLLRQLHCKPTAKVTKKRSAKVPKGDVISTKPGRGSRYRAGTAVRIVVSSGKPARKAVRRTRR